MFTLLLCALLNPPPVSDPPPVRAGSWLQKPSKKSEDFAVAKHPWMVVHERVKRGETVWVSVGEDYPGAVRIDNLPDGVEPGVYKCSPKEDGTPGIAKLVKPQPVVVPEPVFPRLFNPPLLPVVGGT